MISEKDIFDIDSNEDFESLALEVYTYQYDRVEVYKAFSDSLGLSPCNVTFEHIPFLPIRFFKSYRVCSNKEHETLFLSSGTTSSKRSKHYVSSLHTYRTSFLKAFDLFFGSPSDYVVLALLPSYLEQGDSSLVYMTQELIKQGKPRSGFFLNDLEELSNTINQLELSKQKWLLLGVSYALLDFIELFPKTIQFGQVLETGGMKGRRKELTKEELHEQLSIGFGTKEIASEYGMTELLSQAYSVSKGRFNCPPWMQIKIRSISDPLDYVDTNKTGLINVIDLANMHSCSFIATDDLGKLTAQGFKILGRHDFSEIRGCNLLIE